MLSTIFSARLTSFEAF